VTWLNRSRSRGEFLVSLLLPNNMCCRRLTDTRFLSNSLVTNCSVSTRWRNRSISSGINARLLASTSSDSISAASIATRSKLCFVFVGTGIFDHTAPKKRIKKRHLRTNILPPMHGRCARPDHPQAAAAIEDTSRHTGDPEAPSGSPPARSTINWCASSFAPTDSSFGHQ